KVARAPMVASLDDRKILEKRHVVRKVESAGDRFQRGECNQREHGCDKREDKSTCATADQRRARQKQQENIERNAEQKRAKIEFRASRDHPYRERADRKCQPDKGGGGKIVDVPVRPGRARRLRQAHLRGRVGEGIHGRLAGNIAQPSLLSYFWPLCSV